MSSHGIIYYDPLEAAEAINKNSNLNAWWFSNEVQNLRKRFISKYFLMSDKSLQVWMKFVREAYKNL